MAELSKEYFDQQLGKLVTKKDFEQVLDEKFEEQARLIAKSFDAVDEKFEEVNQSVAEVKDSLQVIEAKVNKALNIEYVRLEKRLKVVEQKLGIASAKDSD